MPDSQEFRGPARLAGLLFVGIASLSRGLPQTAAPSLPSFDVASVKPVQPSPPYSIDLGNTLHGRVTLTNVTLTECLRFAFKINNDGQFAGPEWIKSRDTSFDIVAKAPPDTPKDQLRLMMSKLLTERFQLKLHHEQRDLPHYELAVDKKGSKLREAAGTDDSGDEVRQGRIAVHGVSIATLIVLVGRFTSMPIVDMTELKGSYDVHLEWTPRRQTAKQSDGAAVLAEPEGPTLFEALPEQLGLKLEMRKGPMDVIVVDHAEKTPLAN
jgi:uncharacterized protein (TIGR03435 family)